MSVYPYGDYKSTEKNNDYIIFPLKMTNELSHQLENLTVKELSLYVNGETSNGVLRIGNSEKCTNQFDVTFSDASAEQRHLCQIRSNKRMDILGSLNCRIVAKATQNSYDITKKFINKIEDENNQHKAKELKLVNTPTSRGALKPMEKNQLSKFVQKSDNSSLKRYLMHLIAPQSITLNQIMLKFAKYENKKPTVDNMTHILKEISTCNNKNEYVLNPVLYHNINENWSQYNGNEKRCVINYKSKYDENFKKSISSENNNTPKQSFQIETKINALDMLKKGAQFKEVCSKLKIPEFLLSTWKKEEFKLRQNYEQSLKKVPIEDLQIKTTPFNPFSNKISENIKNSQCNSNGNKESSISPKIPDDKNLLDEGFDSGSDKISPKSVSSIENNDCNDRSNNSDNRKRLNSNYNHDQKSKRVKSNNSNEDSIQASQSNHPISNTIPIMLNNQLSDVNNHSSSSCDVTPKSDVSINTSQPKNLISNDSRKNSRRNPDYINKLQEEFNNTYEEYKVICKLFEEKDKEIKLLHHRCSNGEESSEKLIKRIEALTVEFQSEPYKKLMSRFYMLENKLGKMAETLSPYLNPTNNFKAPSISNTISTTTTTATTIS